MLRVERKVITILKINNFENNHEKTFTALGTINTLTVFGEKGKEAIDAAIKRVLEIDDRMSAFKASSDVMKINLSSGIKVQKINKDTFNLLKQSIEFSMLSKGSFDITIGPLTSLWGFGKKMNYIPKLEEIQKILPLVNYQDLILDENNCTAFLEKNGQAIDLGSIAKGYAADEVKRILLQYKIKNALINLGGNIVVLGHNPEKKLWRIGIQNPFAARGNYIGTVRVEKGTIVTSGSNEQFFIKDGVRYHHIIDPRTGYPANKELLSVTVLCESSTYADALTTDLFVSGIENALSILKSAKAEAIFVMQNHDVFVTDGLRGNFERSFSI